MYYVSTLRVSSIFSHAPIILRRRNRVEQGTPRHLPRPRNSKVIPPLIFCVAILAAKMASPTGPLSEAPAPSLTAFRFERPEPGADEPILAVDTAAQKKAGVIVERLEAATNRSKIRTYGVVINPSSLVATRQRYVAARARLEISQAELRVAEEEYQMAKLLYSENQNISRRWLPTPSKPPSAEAAWRGASERLAPILMTALVTTFGLLPLALGSHAAGREIEGPMAIVIQGGLATSTLINLLVLPPLTQRYGKFERRLPGESGLR